jgi:hypothetical protein
MVTPPPTHLTYAEAEEVFIAPFLPRAPLALADKFVMSTGLYVLRHVFGRGADAVTYAELRMQEPGLVPPTP